MGRASTSARGAPPAILTEVLGFVIVEVLIEPRVWHCEGKSVILEGISKHVFEVFIAELLCIFNPAGNLSFVFPVEGMEGDVAVHVLADPVQAFGDIEIPIPSLTHGLCKVEGRCSREDNTSIVGSHRRDVLGLDLGQVVLKL